MSFALLLPIALTALAAVLLPLIIHLSRRSEQRITDFAALRWISAKLNPRRKIIFQEIPLLLLRLLLLILLALFLANPVSMRPTAAQHWVLMVPGMDVRTAQAAINAENAQWHWLAPGFPEITTPPADQAIAFSSLLRELDATLPKNFKITVITPEQLDGLDGQRIALSRNIEWKTLPGEMRGTTAANKLALNFSIRYSEAQAGSLRFFRATQAAWQEPSEKASTDIATTDTPLSENTKILIWLSEGELPDAIRAWVNNGGTLMLAHEANLPEIQSGAVAWRNSQGQPLVRSITAERGRILQWQQSLKPQTIPELLEADFPDHLQRLLVENPTSLPTKALAITQTPTVLKNDWPQQPQSWQAWLATLIAVLWLFERWMASSARRWSAP